MDILKNLFYGFPDLWGGGVALSNDLGVGHYPGFEFRKVESKGSFSRIGMDSFHRPHLRSLLSQSR